MMTRVNRPFHQAIFVLAGTTIGAGIFGIPYVTAHAGLVPGLFWLMLLTVVVVLIDLMYAQVVIRQKKSTSLQLASLGEKYLGNWGKTLALIIILVGQWGALLAYIIGIGKFLGVIFDNPSASFGFSIIFFFVASAVTYFNLRVVSEIDSWLTIAMVLIIGLIAITGFPLVNGSNLLWMPRELSSQFWLPFGVCFAALTNYAVIPEVVRIAGTENQKKINKAVILGTLIPFLLYVLFQVIVVGISGKETTEEAIRGLVPFLDTGIIKLGALFGILAMATSHLTLTHVIKDTFHYDYHFPAFRSWYFANLPPFIVFLLGLNSFIIVLDVMGTWLGITSALFITILFWKSRKKN